MQKLKLTRVTAIVIGVIISLVVIGGGLFTYFSVFSRASNQAPVDVRISEITSQSAIISWTTDEETQGTIEYGNSPAEMGFYAPEALSGVVHRVELTLLQPNTMHYFIIRIGDNVYDNGGIPWTFTTKDVKDEEVSTPEAELTDAPDEELTEKPEATPTKSNEDEEEEETTVTPRPTTRRSSTATPTKRPATATPRATSTPRAPTATRVSCSTTNCSAIAGYLGPGKCTVQDYYKCLYKNVTPSITPSISVTPTVIVETPNNAQATLNGGQNAITVSFYGKNYAFSFEVERYTFGVTAPSPTAIITTGTPSGWSVVATIAGIGSTSTDSTYYTYTDTSVVSGNSYRYRIRAIKSGVYSNYGPGTDGTPAIKIP